ncbi:MAG: T9SS type A sorting domain-containing protein [Bacteroidetes bacterium]|nr:T9SS type A sorting domain-containing protein [Bacteroidota bacterium]
MKKPLLLLSLLSTLGLFAQNIKDSSIMINAAPNSNETGIIITWKTTDAQSFQIQRKTLNTNTWDNPLANLAGTASSYEDTSAKKGTIYEYRILKIKGNVIRAVGYTSAGMSVPLTNYKRNILLLVDSSTYNGIDSTLWIQLKQDYYMDGYGVDLKLVSEYSKPPAIKSTISAWHSVNRSLNNQVLLIGRVPVAYSGTMLAATFDLPPDAHPDHGGAWPTDLYYAEMDGSWPDNATMTTNVTRDANKNLPGDGKFDPHFIPNDIDIQIGRIDFRILPAQGKTDIQLVEQYLNKLHRYKTGQVKVSQRAFISDNFNYLGGEMPMRSGWNNASTIVGINNITNTGNYFDSTRAKNWLWANTMGGGSFTNCSGVGNASQFKDSILAVFNVSFGSYFGDWYTTDNFLRSCLASKGLTLTNVWAHRPHWYFHQMAMGTQIGHSVITSQNNETDFSLATGYIGSFSGSYLDRRISMNLMGDPALRLRYLSMPGNLTATPASNNTQVSLSWTASNEPGILGYNVYRTNKKGDIYYAINTSPVTGLTFTDTDPYSGTNYYVVKAVKMETGPCGTYMNSSLGVMAEIGNVNGTNTSITAPMVQPLSIYPNPGSGQINISGSDFATVKIYDTNGRLMYSQYSENGHLQVDASTWTKGIYIVTYTAGNSIVSGKLVIQ